MYSQAVSSQAGWLRVSLVGPQGPAGRAPYRLSPMPALTPAGGNALARPFALPACSRSVGSPNSFVSLTQFFLYNRASTERYAHLSKPSPSRLKGSASKFLTFLNIYYRWDTYLIIPHASFHASGAVTHLPGMACSEIPGTVAVYRAAKVLPLMQDLRQLGNGIL